MAPSFEDFFDHLPLIPKSILRLHQIHRPMDTRFRSAARLLQALWRADKDLAMGRYTGLDGKSHKLGSRISAAAGRAGENFLTPQIAALAQRETCYREVGAMIDEERLFTNLLSSMPLTFNIFGLMRLDAEFANRVLAAMITGFDGAVRQVLFEHSPSRGNPAFTNDRTAFDALIRYSRLDGRKGFLAIEVKYSESCTENIPPLGDRMNILSSETGLFIDADAAALRTNPLQQFWREHCLAQSMIMNGLYDEGSFVLVAPQLNRAVQAAATAYRTMLDEQRDNSVHFKNWYLEDLIEAIGTGGAPGHAGALHNRYCNFWRVDGEIEIALTALLNKAREKAIANKTESGEHVHAG